MKELSQYKYNTIFLIQKYFLYKIKIFILISMIRKEWIGVKVWIKRTNTNIVIEDDPKKYDYYKSLGLDIFVKEEKKNDSNKSKSSQYNRGNSKRKNKS